MNRSGYLGIDAGTQGLSLLLVDEKMRVVATASAGYDMVPGLANGCYEQHPLDWERAMRSAANQLWQQVPRDGADQWSIRAIGVSGQMHGEVLCDENGEPLGSARLWCDGRNEAEGEELTRLLGVKMPKRITAARWLWTVRQRPEVARRTAHLTTPAGWLAFRLTGEWNLGIGDASGMFPIDQAIQDYSPSGLEQFDRLTVASQVKRLRELLPRVRRAGEDGGALSEAGARLLGIPAGVPVAPAEGDQPAALAGSLIGDAGMVSMSFGTSVCANSVADRPFQGVHRAIDHFCAVDGKPINMVFLRNGTTFMNTVVGMFGLAAGGNREDGFAAVMPAVLNAPPDCGGILAFPFMDDEPGLGVPRGGMAGLIGFSEANAAPGNVVKAALLATVFNLRYGMEVLDQQGIPRKEIVLSGGLTRTPQLGQIIADVFHMPVSVLESGSEGTAWGAALLAKFRVEKDQRPALDWSEFLIPFRTAERVEFKPLKAASYQPVYERYRRLLASEFVHEQMFLETVEGRAQKH